MTPKLTGRAVPFVRYDEHGQVTEWGVQDAGVTAYQQHLGQRILEGKGDADHVVLDGKIIPRLNNPAVLEGTTIKRLPKPSTLKIGSEIYVVTDGTAELDLTYPGTYTVVVTTTRHLPKTFEIVV